MKRSDHCIVRLPVFCGGVNMVLAIREMLDAAYRLTPSSRYDGGAEILCARLTFVDLLRSVCQNVRMETRWSLPLYLTY